MLGKKAQEQMPFELLVSVIIMGFVIAIGLYAMWQVEQQRCYNETESGLEELKTLLESVVSQREPQVVTVRSASCYDERDVTIRIKSSNEPNVCADYCKRGKQLCTLLEYYYSGVNYFSLKKCLNISPDAAFPSNAGNCPARAGFELVDFKDRIVEGHYELINKSATTSTFPTVCAYRRVP